MSDNVKHPSHYVEGRKFEPKDVIRDWGLNFNVGSAVKYLSRAGRKDDIVQDLKKAQEFIQFEIDAIEAHRVKEEKPKFTGEVKDHPNCRCSVKSVMPKVGIIELEVPVGTPPEEVIQMAIKKIYGGE